MSGPPDEVDHPAGAVEVRRLDLLASYQPEGLESLQGPLHRLDGSPDAGGDGTVTGPGDGLVAGPEEQGGDDADIDRGQAGIGGDVVEQLCEGRGWLANARFGAYHDVNWHQVLLLVTTCPVRD